MARRKRAEAHGGGHGWYVTFADLMGLMMAFFVMIAAFSTMNQEKMKQALGSIREAFGVQMEHPQNGAIMEIDGLPVRGFPKNVAHADIEDVTDHPGPVDKELDNGPLKTGRDFTFATAATTLRQALQDMPEIAEISQNIVLQELPDGVAIELTDQDGRSMFPQGSKEPYGRTKAALVAMAPVIGSLPQRIAITGHTAAAQAGAPRDFSPWDVSAGRANAVRQILVDAGVPDDHFHSITGRADTEPLYPDNPYLPANRRVTILLMSEPPPLPMDAKP